MFRFLSLGAINTLSTLALYQVLLFILSPGISYVISWVAGFLFLVTIYPKVVFGVNLSIKVVLKISVIYISSLLIGVFMVNLLEGFDINSRLLIVLVLTITTIYNYGFMRFFLEGNNDK
jgi:uncharacterized membrane protein